MGLLSKAIISASPPARPEQAAQERRNAGEKAVWNELRNHWLRNPSSQGIVLELPERLGEAGFETFFAMAASMASSVGRTVPLPSKNILILFSKARDRELLTHRLAKSLRTRALASFEAGSPGEAFSRIQSCL
jgi:hypothetical protein